MRRLALLVFVLALGARPPGACAVADVRYADDRLTVHLEKVEIADVLTAVAGATGAEVRGGPKGPRQVTADFERVAITDALQRLLGDQNFTLRYGEGGKLKAIVLRGGPETPVVPPPPAAVAALAPPPAAGPPTTIVLPRRFAQHRPLPVPEQLATLLGSDKATFDQIFQLATTDDDGVVRAMAMQLALSALEREHALRRALFLSLRRGQEGSLGAFLQTPGAIEMLQFMAAHSREPGLQKKANLLIEQVRPSPAAPPAGG